MSINPNRVVDRFRKFVEEANIHACPLYAHLAGCISDDFEMLAIASEVRRPPVPNTFFAAVHFMLLSEPEHALHRYYRSLTEFPEQPVGSYPVFRAFVLAHQSEIIQILHSRITQTNEVRRCSYLAPAFQRVFEAGGHRSLSLIDVGCSAGLHLLWDRYHYDYGGLQTGNPDSPVQIDCELRGSILPPVQESLPPCTYRVGVDLHPVDLQNSEERRWLEALVFPDHPDRRLLLSAAIEVALQDPPSVVAGDAIAILPDQIRQVPDSTTLCVFHCHSLNQLNEDEFKAFTDMILAQSANREIFWLLAEGYEVQLRHLQNGEIRRVNLARKDGHGRWLQWLDA